MAEPVALQKGQSHFRRTKIGTVPVQRSLAWRQYHPSNRQASANLRESGWVSKTVKQEIYDNFLAALASQGEELFPGIIGYDSTVIPEISIALIAKHDMLFLGEKGQAKSRLMRLLARFLDPEIPYWTFPALRCTTILTVR